MKNRLLSIALIVVLMCASVQPVSATTPEPETVSENEVKTPETTISQNDVYEDVDTKQEMQEKEDASEELLYGFDNVTDKIVCTDAWDGTGELWIDVYNDSDVDYTLTITSSDTSVIDLKNPEEKQWTIQADSNEYIWVEYETYKCGTAKFTVQFGELTRTIPCFRYDYANEKQITASQIDYNTLELQWEPVEFAAGYIVMRAESDLEYYFGGDNYQEIVRLYGADKCKTTIDVSDWETTYSYKVVVFMKMDDVEFVIDDYNETFWVPVKMEKLGTSITSLKASGKSKIKVKWKAVDGAKEYRLYRSTKKNGSYKKIYSGNGTKTSYTDKVSKGVTYYYKICVVYPEFTSRYSRIVSKMLPKDAGKTKKDISVSLGRSIGEQYSYYSATCDRVFYYTKGDKLYLVCPGDNCIKIHTLNSSFKVTKTKTVKVKYEIWGGFYAAADGNFYIVVGYENQNESKTKTVIKVIKYNKNWKKVKTASIKGNATNVFEGIVIPFRAGSCSMDMKENTLYIHTSRQMFMHADGLRHQSNISFAVDTKTMKAVATEDAYASHSFNQYAKFDGDDLYLLDHGDAYPRSILLTKVSNYGTDDELSAEYELFKLKGATGDNYTGCTVGGMEVGEKNVLVCGAAHPHYSKVKGVKGSKPEYAYNVYLLVTDKETGETKIKWLTKNNPKTTKVNIEGTRMLKLDDNRYAIMYTATKGGSSTLYYVVVNGDGKKIYSKKYKGYQFKSGTQPIVYKGRVVWMASEYDRSAYRYKNKMYAIPALTK